MTLLLNRTDLLGLLTVEAGLEAIRAGFAAEPTAVVAQRVRTELPGPGTATALIPGLVDGIPAYTVKANAKFPAAHPALRGVVCLHDLGTGELLAVLDSATITAWRTGLAAALGTHLLARPDAETVGVIGAGAQADLVVRGLRQLREFDLIAYDTDAERARAFHQATVVDSSRDLAAQADVVVLATWSRAPILTAQDVRDSMHLTSLGADEPGKVELAGDVFATSRVIVDDVQLAANVGTTNAAATLADVVNGHAEGRRDTTERTVYAPVGLPWQDLAMSWIAYQAAQTTDTGTRYDWLA
ncbi:ornithine cyclodeaminase family protein [Tenggerimyces flavus]|uniref:Ornithine cyclodeaminase family protein n=1 Tax=Tenggerimyces flavus TaxID=1708749 RepID=A0ABV7YFB3_9ACTN|nr:NAD(P)-binding domain-containing protein [Tenggerimyces flavus]MBM7784282.1 ornithine cyclodeaminase [Tenggerimyces flavus]